MLRARICGRKCRISEDLIGECVYMNKSRTRFLKHSCRIYVRISFIEKKIQLLVILLSPFFCRSSKFLSAKSKPLLDVEKFDYAYRSLSALMNYELLQYYGCFQA